jgi:hypothetical protein
MAQLVSAWASGAAAAGDHPHDAAWLYRWHLGWLVGHRFLILTYRGRRTGRHLQTVLEVMLWDPTTQESVVVSAYGPRAGWYLSIRSQRALRVQTGRLDYRPRQRLLEADEAAGIAAAYCRQHRLAAWLAPHVLHWIGAANADRSAAAEKLLASLPMVTFRPSGESKVDDLDEEGESNPGSTGSSR